MSDPLLVLQGRIGYAFQRPELLQQAVTHPSFLQEHPLAGDNNQRLEFLGDAVLQLVLSDALFTQFPLDREGALTKNRAALTKGRFQIQLAQTLGLDGALRLGQSETQAGARGRESSLEDAFEAMIGAIYLDGGFEAARRVVLALYGSLPAHLEREQPVENPKGRLQEFVQPVHGNNALRYVTTQVGGADHAREYEAEVFLLDRALGKGRGSSKKTAEEAAARAALAAWPPA